jgi:phage gp29-like protein
LAPHLFWLQAIAKVTLGQTLTSEAAGGQYKAEVQMDVRNDIVKADADLVCESFNRAVARWLTDWNYPGAAYPRVFRRIEDEPDLKPQAERDEIVSRMGFRPTLKYVVDTYGGEWEEKSAELPPTAPAFAEGGAVAPAARANRADQQALADAAEALSAQWHELVGRRLEDLLALLEETQDLALFRERLAELLEAEPPREVIEALARAGFAAHALGRTQK